MANSIQVSVLCASGRIASFGDNNMAERTTTTLQTSGTGLNQTSGVDLGNFLVGETIVAAFATVTALTTVADTVGFMYAYVENADGSIAVPIEGGGNKSGCMPMLCRPVRVQVGMLLKGALAIVDTTASDASLVAYCASGKTSVFTVAAVADTKTAIDPSAFSTNEYMKPTVSATVVAAVTVANAAIIVSPTKKLPRSTPDV